MQEKIQKLFSFFKNIKNQPFYTSCITQIIQVYENCPESLKLILYNLNQLIFSDTKQVRLRLKHRQICASIISKLNAKYVLRVKSFLNDGGMFEIQSFQLQSSELQKGVLPFSSQPWEDINYIKLIEQTQPLYSSSRYIQEIEQHDQELAEKNFFQQFHELKQATMINMQQLLGELNTEDKTQSHATSNSKYNEKAKKLKNKNQNHQTLSQLIISNPFNLIYEICIENILSTQWELRHLSVLIIKELFLNPQLLGFSQKIQMPKLISTEARFQYLSSETRRLLNSHFKQSKFKQKMLHQITKNCMFLLCLDRFADYQSDESNIIVRAQGAEILKVCYQTLEQSNKVKMLKIMKKIFDHYPQKKQAKDPNVKQLKTKDSLFSWQVKHSFVYFLSLIADKKSNIELIFKHLEQSLIKMISCNQFDEIIVYVCRCLGRFIGEHFFTEKAMSRINQQLWSIVQNLDDISISSKETLTLLGRMFNSFKLNESLCLEKIKKYYTSKIPEVRQELYCLSTQLYSRNFKPDPETIDKNLMQFLQAVYVQAHTNLIHQLELLSPNIFQYTLKTDKVGRMTYFLSHILLRYETANSVINQYFKVYEGSSMLQNDYIYINQEQKLNVSLEVYINRRIFKFARVLSYAFKDSLTGLSQLCKTLQEEKQFTNRGQLFILCLLGYILQLKDHTKQKFFQDQKDKIQSVMTLEYHQISDLHIEALRHEFRSRLQAYSQVDESLREYNLAFKSKNWKDNSAAEIRSHLLVKHQKNPDTTQIRILLSLLDGIIDIQKSLLKNMKMAALYIIMKVKYPQQPPNLSTVMATIHGTIIDDKYYLMSWLAAECLTMLTQIIFKDKKAKCLKITTDTIEKVAKKYNKTALEIKENPQNIRFQGTFMEGFSIYIQKVGKSCKEWLELFSSNFLNQMCVIEPNIRNNKLFLLSGVIQSLLTLQSPQFLNQLLTNINSIIDMDHSENKNYLMTILTKIFLYFCHSYSGEANIFFQWFLNKLEEHKMAVYIILQNLGRQQISRIGAVCALFIMQIVRSVTVPQIQGLVMGCLSNLIVGVYTNVKVLNLSPKLQQIYEQGTQFVKNFKDASKFSYEIQVELKKQIELRHYQLEGISWLGFLTKYNLNGALCDDMGLGKTLQVLILIENQYQKLIKNKRPEGNLNSLIIVPTTIMEHWAFQHSKYFVKKNCKTLIIDQNRILQDIGSLKGCIIITNYNLIEKNIGIFEKQQFNFIVLDEGHIIKNIDGNKFKSVKRLRGMHRFILTGTPIQNRLKQLWGLFDFLMPGYLYTKELFKKNYDKLFQVNLTTFKEDQLMFSEGQRKTLDKLHFKVMPFIMRRLKTDVLQQLPNKIINDYYCTLTPVQYKLYSEFEGKSFNSNKQRRQFEEVNVLKSLSQMKKILNHPALLGGKEVYEDSGKFIALGELFQQLGLSETDSILQSKVIIFSRSNKTIELIQHLFMKKAFPEIKYLKLTGSVKPSYRFTIAQTFNGDSDIKVLLVTTAVGGEGLNLCSANVVVMFDHDYNPTVDMQAIDRAHRIGQKRVLNVYRLITKDTLEEKIMGIQKFKTNLANAIVNIDNASIKNIQQSRLPELLENVRDLQQSEEAKKKVASSFYQRMIDEIDSNAINQNEFKKQY